MPIVKIGTLRYFFSEFVIYFALGFYIIDKLLKKKITFSKLSKIFLKFIIGYIGVIILVFIIKGEYLPIHLQQFRLSLTSIIWIIFLDFYSKKMTRIQVLNFIKRFINLLIIVPLITLFSYFNNSFRNIIYKIYDPQIAFYDSVGYIFQGFRETSIFSDYFISSIFLISYFFCLINYQNHFKSKIILFLYCIITFFAAVATARTAVIFIILISILFLFKAQKKMRKNLILILLFGAIVFSFIQNIYSRDTITWFYEAFDIVNNSSTNDLGQTVNISLSYLFTNYQYIFIPLHPPSFDILSLKFYTDNYYIQEIFRNGIYGFIIFFMMLHSLFKYFRSYNMILFYFLILTLINVKGGNVFFLERASIFIFTFLFFYDKLNRIQY